MLVDDELYAANTDALVRFAYERGATEIADRGEKVADLPAGSIHDRWTKNVIASPDGSRLFVTVGSNSNIGENGLENEERRAAILEIDPVDGRSAHVDERVASQRPALVADAVVPDYALGPHTASLGPAFNEDSRSLPDRYDGGAFIGQHSSWNREPLSGYKVVFVRFSNGQPEGLPSDVLTRFLDEDGRRTDGLSALRARTTARCSWPTMSAIRCGAPPPNDRRIPAVEPPPRIWHGACTHVCTSGATEQGVPPMLQLALVFLIVALIAGVLGLTGIAGLSANIAWILFVVGLVLALIMFALGRRPRI